MFFAPQGKYKVYEYFIITVLFSELLFIYVFNKIGFGG